jgi:hypothetical protein
MIGPTREIEARAKFGFLWLIKGKWVTLAMVFLKDRGGAYAV